MFFFLGGGNLFINDYYEAWSSCPVCLLVSVNSCNLTRNERKDRHYSTYGVYIVNGLNDYKKMSTLTSSTCYGVQENLVKQDKLAVCIQNWTR